MIKNLNIGNIKNIGRGNCEKASGDSTHFIEATTFVCAEDDSPIIDYEKASGDSTHFIEATMFVCTEDDSPIIDYKKARGDSIHLLRDKLPLVCDNEPERAEKSYYYEKLADLVTDTSIKNSPEYTKSK